MARTQIRGTSQILNATVNYAKIEATSLVESTYDGGLGIASASVSADTTVPSTYAVKLYVTSQINSLAAGLIYKGTFDASLGNYDALLPGSQGDFWKINQTGSVSGVDWTIGDMLILNQDVSGSFVPAAAVDKIDNTESADILTETNSKVVTNKSMDGTTNTFTNINVTSLTAASGDAGEFLLVSPTGTITSSAISASNIFDFTEAAQDAVGNALVNTGNVQFNYNDSTNTISASVSADLIPLFTNYVSEVLTDLGAHLVYTCSQIPIIVISLTVDGLEQEEGIGADYTIDKATRTITFTSANHANDRVWIKYFKG